MTTVAEQFAATLAAAGVKRIYGIVGDSLNGLTDAIRRQGKIQWVHVRHEEGRIQDGSTLMAKGGSLSSGPHDANDPNIPTSSRAASPNSFRGSM